MPLLYDCIEDGHLFFFFSVILVVNSFDMMNYKQLIYYYIFIDKSTTALIFVDAFAQNPTVMALYYHEPY